MSSYWATFGKLNMSDSAYHRQRMPDASGNSSDPAMSQNTSSQQNYTRALDTTDSPHNQHSNTQLLNYQNSLANNNHAHSNHISNNVNNSNDNNNNNPSNRNSAPPLRRPGTNNDISSSQDDSDVPMSHGSTESSTQQHDLFAEIRNGGGHWSQLLRQVVLTAPPHVFNGTELSNSRSGTGDSIVPLQVHGGSENGQFAFVGQVNPNIGEWITVGYLQSGDVLLDIQGQQVAGYTQADVLSLLHHCLQRNSATLTVAPRGNLGPELRSYLNTRFQKGSVDHALQGVVRDNLYLRTVPVTTRPPRPGEIPGVDYTFLSIEGFMELERDGSLLESGVYAGNHYGTPKPWATRLRAAENQNSEDNQGTNEIKSGILPGMHPSSEGKRRRNRSNVEALGAGDDDEPASPTTSTPQKHSNTSYSTPGQPVNELGPLPANWEMSYTEKGEVYFIDHNTGTSHWLDPRLSRVQKTALEDCADNELPFGWERIEDPHYGTYYIDHVNRRTQYENPVLQAKSSKSNLNANTSNALGDGEVKKVPPVAPPKPTSHKLSIAREKTPVHFSSDEKQPPNHSSLMSHQPSLPSSSSSSVLRIKATGGRIRHNFFTRDPNQLEGERIRTVLLKSARGLGFTIVGGDDDDGLDEFLQIKSVVEDGPAWRDGKLRTGDVLVCVNNLCVLGYTHQEMVSIFQSIGAGEEVELEVCRGYPLPFDPADPNTEIVTTMAVLPTSGDGVDKRDWRGGSGTPDSMAHSAHSLPELSMDRVGYGKGGAGRPASVDLLLDPPNQDRGDVRSRPKMSNLDSGMFLPIDIMKGNGGFGFTIADSISGQKVKKVLDPTHCGGLEEGDRLIEIDGINLQNLSHAQVVQVLKDFPLRRAARLIIHRIQRRPPLDHKSGSGNTDYPDARFSNTSGMPRSKTPTGDLGRNRPKLREMLPERPKTPLLDASGHMNGHAVQNSMSTHNSYSHPYLEDRFSNSMGGLPPNQEPNFNDLNQIAIIRDWREMTIELHRKQEGFGFRIIGGTEEGSQVSVGHIVPRGAAYIDGRLQTNDQIMAVDGVSVVGASHHSVVQLMARSAALGRVTLVIRRPIYGSVAHPGNAEFAGSPQHSPGSGPIQVTLRRQASEGFGFVIISSAVKAGATIGRIVEGSPADRCGQLHVGDRILAVNQIDISQLHHSQVVQLIKDSGLVLTLNVLPVSLNIDQDPSLTQPSPSELLSNMSISDFENLSLKNSGYDIGTAFVSPESHSVHFGTNMPGSGSHEDDVEQLFSVQLNRGNRGFGFSIRGGKEFQNMPLFVLRLADDGPAAMDGRIQVGDQILQINGYNTQGMTHAQAIHIIKSGDNVVYLLLRRGAVPFPFLSQAFSSGFGGSNGQEEEQSVSSNNDPQQFVNQNSPLYRDHGN